MVLVLKKKSSKTLREQVDEVLLASKSGKNKHAWNKFFGKVEWNVDPVNFQRSLRDE